MSKSYNCSKSFQVILLIYTLIFSLSSVSANPKKDIFQPVRASQGMVSTQEAIASEVGLQILKQGGNAVDSAVAVGFAMAVTYPRAGNLGGGGFMMIYLADKKKIIAIDYREMAPAAATRDMFLNKHSNVDIQKARNSHLSSAVPGTVAGLLYVLNKYGSMSLSDVMAPAIELAEKGFVVTPYLQQSLQEVQGRLKLITETRRIFYPFNNHPVPVGQILVQKDLAQTLKLIAKQGGKAFYQGKIAKMISADSLANGGIITLEDLANYKVIERTPVVGSYRGYKIVSMPPPSSGGIHLIQILNILEGWDINKLGIQSVKTINFIAEGMKHAYADRSVYLGDTDFYDVPIKTLTSKHYATELHNKIDLNNITASTDILPGKLPHYESDQTTHYSIIDKFGNAVANTYTLNSSYGNSRVVKGAGFLMNNEMDDFSSKPGSPNMFGLLGNEANAIEAGKRPLSSMTPTMIFKEDQIFMVTGSPGGSRIINAVLQTIINVIDHKMNIAAATLAPRFHHQWFPDVLVMEKGFNSDVINQLRKIGYKVKANERYGIFSGKWSATIGKVQSIVKNGNHLTGFSDPRRAGSLTLGY